MREIQACNHETILLGIAGEYGVTDVHFDISDFLGYGSGTFYLLHKRKGDASTYKATNFTINGNELIWHVGQYDTQSVGYGAAEIQFKKGNAVLAKSPAFTTYTARSLSKVV